ncbi:MAG TPA: lysophospholipid acyltransferase family protein [Blastocatellia bacterium]|jgi:1-acyl-sn-glycerol-3-phosphate acyltransferase|nr:lysophospholipid acyltransferase family protein [Blastocatellia bacterium]
MSVEKTMDVSATIDALTKINTEDFLEALGLEKVRVGRGVLELLCRRAARRFAEEVFAYDAAVGRTCLCEGAAALLWQNVGSLHVSGVENVPLEGPLLVASNHPGLTDSIALFASLPRKDLFIVAADRPFLRAIGETSKHIIYLKHRSDFQITALREIVRRLNEGRAVLIFPGGQIEPDPSISNEASRALEDWSKSIGLIVRLAKNVRVVTAIVSGVSSPLAQKHPLTKLRRERRDREKVGAVLQIMWERYRSVEVKIAYGEPLARAELLEHGGEPEAVTRRIIESARHLVERPPTVWQPVASGICGDAGVTRTAGTL